MLAECYSEASNSLRHYSAHVFKTRNVTLAQGLAAIGAAAFLVREGDPLLASATAVFGVLLTITLWMFNWNYYFHFGTILDTAIELEKKMLSAQDVKGPWEKYSDARSKSAGGLRGLFMHFGTFIFVGAALLIIAVFGLFVHFAEFAT